MMVICIIIWLAFTFWGCLTGGGNKYVQYKDKSQV